MTIEDVIQKLKNERELNMSEWLKEYSHRHHNTHLTKEEMDVLFNESHFDEVDRELVITGHSIACERLLPVIENFLITHKRLIRLYEIGTKDGINSWVLKDQLESIIELQKSAFSNLLEL